MTTESNRTDHAIRHLKCLKPYDGWSADKYINSQGNELVMLRRRNVSLSKTGYTAIAYDENDSKCVVGITSLIGETGNTIFYRAVVLVEKDGVVAREQRAVRVSLKKVVGNTKEQSLNDAKEQNRRNIEKARISSSNDERNNAAGGFSAENILGKLSDEDTSDMAKLSLIFICVVTVLRIISSFKFMINAIVLPLLVLYAMQNCPTNESFDAKKELKRVLRGHHLPQGHQDKPADDWLSRTVARVTASVAAEAATALGYEVSFFSIAGICTVATVDVPISNKEFYWVGAFGSWRYIMQKDVRTPQQQS